MQHAQQKPTLITATATKPQDLKATDEVQREAIATAAYYRAMARNFEPGHELDDWVAAEKEVTSRRAARPA